MQCPEHQADQDRSRVWLKQEGDIFRLKQQQPQAKKLWLVAYKRNNLIQKGRMSVSLICHSDLTVEYIMSQWMFKKEQCV